MNSKSVSDYRGNKITKPHHSSTILTDELSSSFLREIYEGSTPNLRGNILGYSCGNDQNVFKPSGMYQN
jgi:hypothetical protein